VSEADLVRMNLFRKGLRTSLLMVSILVAFFIFGVLGSFDYAFNFAKVEHGENRLVITNKISLTQPMPLAHLEKIRAVEGVTAATMTEGLGATYQSASNTLYVQGVDPKAFLKVHSGSITIDNEARAKFLSDRRALVIERRLAERYGIRPGQTIPLQLGIPDLSGRDAREFNVVGLIDDPHGAQSAYFNFSYLLDGSPFMADNIFMYEAATDAPAHNDAVAARIDAAFANSGAETRSQDASAFGRAFLRQFGDIALVISLVVSAAFAATLLVVGNSMWLAVRERAREIGVMKTLGFTSARVLRMVLSETVALSLLGAGLGLGLAAAALPGVGPALKQQFSTNMAMPAAVAGLGAGLALMFGLVTGAAPALGAFNLRIVDALGRK
jgi:putative ABC transport system permease protein